MLDDRPLFVFQHPEAGEQSWDMGELTALDPTGSRARYKVSAAHGSSGGATVNADGQLFALHVAEVAPPELRLNQGVRIDFIMSDLIAAGLTNWPSVDSIGRTPADYWSLTDDAPVPLIGRKEFRRRVLQTAQSVQARGEWAFVCRGPKGSGRHFTMALLRRLLGPGIPIAHLTTTALAKPAKEVIHLIATSLNVDDGDVPPDPLPTEDEPRWWRTTLAEWLQERLKKSEGLVGLPAWVIVDQILEEGQGAHWGAGVREVIRALLGGADDGADADKAATPQLRWLFLGGADEAFPAPRERKFDELLPDPEAVQNGVLVPAVFDQQFADCLKLAWWATKPQKEVADEFVALASEDARNSGQPYEKGADYIRRLVNRARGLP